MRRILRIAENAIPYLITAVLFLQKGPIPNSPHRLQGKAVIVRVDKRMKHSLYGKVITKSKKYVAHTETPLEEGKKVTIVETRPLSKTKCWRVKSTS